VTTETTSRNNQSALKNHKLGSRGDTDGFGRVGESGRGDCTWMVVGSSQLLSRVFFSTYWPLPVSGLRPPRAFLPRMALALSIFLVVLLTNVLAWVGHAVLLDAVGVLLVHGG
jgi:hypothetical protein